MFTTRRKGFTLIELVIVIVILGILAAVAIPVYQNLVRDAKESTVKGVVGNVRGAIAIWRAKQLAQDKSSNPTVGYPTTAQLTTPGTVLEGPMADNPFFSEKPGATGSANGVKETAAARGTVTADQGWAYNPANGDFWANSNVSPNHENNF